MDKTIANLKDAFAGESQANRRYLAFARQAEKEGLLQVAKLFRAAADGETIHALAHLRALGEVGATTENLKHAVAGETHEFNEMYPEMISVAETEGHKAARLSFSYANEVEKVHAALYQKALEDPEGLEVCDYYVCRVCGYIHEKEAPDRCPVCGANDRAFFKAD